MSHSDTATGDDSTDTDSDRTESLADGLASARDLVDSVSDSDLADMSDADLAEIRTELKALSDLAESTRKTADSEVKARTDPGESLLGLNHIGSHRKFVAEDLGTVIMRAVGQGIDYTQFVSIDASTLADEHPDLAEIGRNEFTYVR